jgi:hypothetical protein
MARRRRLVEQFRPLRVPKGALGHLVDQVDERVAVLAHDVRLFAKAREQGLLDAGLTREARTAYAQHRERAAVFEGQVSRWVKEPLLPEARQEMARLVGHVRRYRTLVCTLFDILDRPGRPAVPEPQVQPLSPPEVCEAIVRRRLLQFRYRDGEPRLVAPHAHGQSRLRHAVVRAWQMEGASRSGAAVGWKLFLLSEMSDVVLLTRSFRIQDDFGGEDLDVPFVHCAVPFPPH